MTKINSFWPLVTETLNYISGVLRMHDFEGTFSQRQRDGWEIIWCLCLSSWEIHVQYIPCWMRNDKDRWELLDQWSSSTKPTNRSLSSLIRLIHWSPRSLCLSLMDMFPMHSRPPHSANERLPMWEKTTANAENEPKRHSKIPRQPRMPFSLGSLSEECP